MAAAKSTTTNSTTKKVDNTAAAEAGGGGSTVQTELEPRKKQVIFVLGGPGAGKGTQCTNVCRRLRGWATISAGEELRKCKTEHPESEEAKIIESVGRGIVPVEITIRLLKKAMDNYTSRSKYKIYNFLIDGYPRNMDNVEGWDKHVGDDAVVRGIFYFDVSEKDMIARCKSRYEEALKEEKAAKEEDKEYKGEKPREDDADEKKVKERLKVNRDQCEPIVEMYDKKEDIQVFKIDGARSQEEVWVDVKSSVQSVEKAVQREYRASKKLIKSSANGSGEAGDDSTTKKSPNKKTTTTTTTTTVTTKTTKKGGKTTTTTSKEEKKDYDYSNDKFNDGGVVPIIKVSDIKHGIRRCSFYVKTIKCSVLEKPGYVSENAPSLYELECGDETGRLFVRVPEACLETKKPKEGDIVLIENSTIVARRKIKVLLNKYGSLQLSPEKKDIPKDLTALKITKLKELTDIGTVTHKKPIEEGESDDDESESDGGKPSKSKGKGKKGKKGFGKWGKKGKGKGKGKDSEGKGWFKGKGKKGKGKGFFKGEGKKGKGKKGKKGKGKGKGKDSDD